MTLRLRLTIILVAIVAIGLLAADVVTYTALRSFLIRRVDQQLASAGQPMMRLLLSPGPGPRGCGGPESGSVLPAGTYATLYDSSNHEVSQVACTYDGRLPSPPDLKPAQGAAPPFGSAPFTVGAVGNGGLHYRALALTLNNGYTVVVAIPMTEVSQTLSRLLGVAVLVTLCVLVAMALVSWFTVRRELQPLERVEQTAGAIAGGDLSRRVDEKDPHTEVGRLGIALNSMLGRIEQAMEERKASEEALRRFLADASHELRTPLTSIRGYAELFRRGAGATQADTALAMRRIEQESERMSALVDDLLFLERAGSGRPIAREPMDVSAAVSDAVNDARAVDPTRSVELDAAEGLEVIGDEARLRQVFANLMSNALQHTPAGSPIEVVAAGDDGFVSVSVRDHGEGIDPEHLPHVFEPFYRADPARGRVRKDKEGSGTGLGLSIVEAVVEGHGGTVEVSSQVGEGTTFTLRLPSSARVLPEPPDAAVAVES
jgi:two-component system, OmpR family, sensor kinase